MAALSPNAPLFCPYLEENYSCFQLKLGLSHTVYNSDGACFFSISGDIDNYNWQAEEEGYKYLISCHGVER